MAESWDRAREQIVLYCRRMLREGLTYFTAGNISVRIADDTELVAMTPTGLPYDTMDPRDVVIATVNGRIVDGARRPTS